MSIGTERVGTASLRRVLNRCLGVIDRKLRLWSIGTVGGAPLLVGADVTVAVHLWQDPPRRSRRAIGDVGSVFSFASPIRAFLAC
jgi:hypothetical protein